MNKLKAILCSIAAVYGLVLLAAPVIILHLLCDKHVEHGRIFTAEEAGLPTPDTLWLKTDDGLNIHTLELKPEGEAKGAIICISGIENPSVTYFYGHARMFRKLGYITYLPDMRAHGQSDGDRVCLAYKETDDIEAVTDYITFNYPNIPIVVMGLSMGGSVAIRSIGENADIDGMITLSAYSSVEDLIAYQLGKIISPVFAWPVKFTTATYASLRFKINAFESRPMDAICNLDGRPVLMMHSREDSQVPYRSFKKLTNEACHRTEDFQTYVTDGDEHFVTSSFGCPEEDTLYYNTVKNFLVRMLNANKGIGKLHSEYATMSLDDGNSVRIHYKTCGEMASKAKQTMVFVHGFGCDMNTWNAQYDEFHEKYGVRMVFIDLPGYGKSDKPHTDYTLQFYADAVDAVLDKIGVPEEGDVTYIGHSLGTPICRQLLLSKNRSGALVDIDGVYCFYPVLGGDPSADDIAAAEAYEAAVQGFASSFAGNDCRSNIEGFVQALAGPDTPSEITNYAMSVMPETPAYVGGSTMSNLIDRKWWDDRVIDFPTTVICTQNSGLDPDNKEKMQALYSKLNYIELTTCGHFIQMEQPEIVNKILAQK